MKNNKKGFTLIELLAVIVILAIIALIATPIILGIIEDSRKSARENSAKYIASTIDTSYATSYMKSYVKDEASGLGETYKLTAKNAGEYPTLLQVMSETKKNLDNIKAVTYDGTKGVVVSNYDVTCHITNDSGLKVQCAKTSDLNNGAMPTDTTKLLVNNAGSASKSLNSTTGQ